MKLLLAVDDSPLSVPPIQAVALRPWPSSSVVRVLTVVEVPFPVVTDLGVAPAIADAEDELQKTSHATLMKVREMLASSGLPVETRVREGTVGREIVEEAHEWGAELILMGSHGRTGLKGALMGSVAQYVVSHAPCSVEVVRGSAGATAMWRAKGAAEGAVRPSGP